ncbi:AraC family ligand binding domain-containing protein [Actinobacillus seminis]|uniref:AraC family ligand binding domain-containing protein n=1 Tax=Actinobacillus seminis TaxID=722 RepID=UPI003B95505E
MQQNFPRVLHKHDDRLEIVFIVKGRGIHLIGDVKYHTKPDDILIFNRDIIHDEMSELNSDMVVLKIYILKAWKKSVVLY